MSDFIYGRRPVLEALRAGTRPLHKIWVAEGSHGTEEIIRLAHEKGVPLERARLDHLNKRVQGHHQGVVAQASAAKFVELDDFLRSMPHPNPLPRGEGGARPGEAKPIVIIALDEIQDPHNVGAILRSAGFFGVAGLIMPKWRSAPVAETAARVSSGAIEHVPLIRVTNLAQAVLDLQKANFDVVGADMEGEPLEDYQVGRRTVIIFGGEEKGIRRLVRERCDKLLKIPGSGPVGSLNVGASAAIFLHHFCRSN